MTLQQRAQQSVTAIGRLARRALDRGRLEAQIRACERDIARQQAALGKAVHGLLERGALHIDLPEVQTHLPGMRAQTRRLEELHARRDMSRGPAQTDAEARWQDEGGRNVE